MSDKISYVSNRKLLALSLLAIVIAMSCVHIKPTLKGPVPTTLVIGIDGIGYTTFRKLQDGGHFRSFNSVSPMFASFPSISDPNWTHLYGLGLEKGFTKAFFDPTIVTSKGVGGSNGGLTSHITRHPKYEDVSDFRLEGAWEHLSMLIWTETTAFYWLDSLEKSFFEFRGRDTYFALIINSDILSHTEGEPNVMKYLVKIEDSVDRIREKYKKLYGAELEVVFVSDHGNSFLSGKDVPFEGVLKAAGWQVTDTIGHPHDVGFYVPEMLSFGAFFCQPGMSKDLAHLMSKVDHVQSVMYQPSPTEIRVLAPGDSGEGKITFDEGQDLIDYKILRGVDPLKQARHFKNGPLKRSDYFAKSQDDLFPYSVVRIWEGFNINSQIKPQLLVDPEYGYVFGNKALRLVTEVRGFTSTHGSLQREQTMGIFVSTKRQLPAIRPEDFRQYVNISQIGK